MADLYVARHPHTNRIMVGKLNKEKTALRGATDITAVACAVVAEHVLETKKPLVVRHKGEPIYSLHVVPDPKFVNVDSPNTVKVSPLALILATVYATGACDALEREAGEARDNEITSYVERKAVEWEAYASAISGPAATEGENHE